MRVLGLDLSSTSTGWAILEDNLALKEYGIIDFKSARSKKEKLLLLESMIQTIISNKGPFDFIIIEDTFFGKNIKTTQLLSRFAGVAILAAFKSAPATTIALVTVGSLRSAVFPKQKVDKLKVYEYICSRYKIKNIPNDVTDAIVAASFPFIRRIEPKCVQ